VAWCELDSSDSGEGPMASSWELDDPSVFIKGGEFLDYQNDCWLIKKVSAPRDLFVCLFCICFC
jgi:hypothetical protein